MPSNLEQPDWVDAASPGPGRPLVPQVERFSAPLRSFALVLAESLRIRPVDFTQIWGPRAEGLGYVRPSASDASCRAAWCLIGEWLVAYASGCIDASGSVADAHDWFANGRVEFKCLEVPDLTPSWTTIPSRAEAHALIPYLLDPASPGTRRQVLRGEAHAGQRQSRKAAGVYFTPADVAHFMVTGLRRPAAMWLDPACGSGVFLRAVLASDPTAEVFGIDIDPLSTDLAPFVLMLERLGDGGTPPWAIWHGLRLHLATGDALMLGALPRNPSMPESLLNHRRAIQQLMKSGSLPEPALPGGAYGLSSSWGLGAAFPELAHGCDVVIQNPPYAKPDPVRLNTYALHWKSKMPSNIYTLFLELGVRLLAPAGQMAAVVPASLTSSQTAPIMRARLALSDASGSVELLSYDRAPDGIFGDDVKTRCAVLFLDRASVPSLRIGPMQRVTSGNRSTVLKRGGGADLPPATLRSGALPKLGDNREVPLLSAVASTRSTLRSAGIVLRRAPVPSLVQAPHTLTVGPTAYNWLNVQRDPSVGYLLGHDSTHPVYGITAGDELEADAIYAVLSSRLSHWIWSVYGDGFHVNGWLFDMLPAWHRRETASSLAKLGSELWSNCMSRPSVSVNAARKTIAFPPRDDDQDLLDEIDALMLGELELSAVPVNLREWSHRTKLAGRTMTCDATSKEEAS